MNVLTGFYFESIRIPVIGQISAGGPIETLPVIGYRTIRKPTHYGASQRYFATRIVGESLRDDAIRSGDIAICRFANSVTNGKLAAVLLNGGVTMKYFYQDPDGTIWLEGAHPDYPAKSYRPEDVQVQAQVIRIERDL